MIFPNVILNLLSNAIKYSGPGKLILFETRVGDKMIEVVVADAGMGIPEEEQEQMFKKFFRAKNALTVQGTGLGLTIVKRYLDLMRGTVSFTSVMDEGTKFIIQLPPNGF